MRLHAITIKAVPRRWRSLCWPRTFTLRPWHRRRCSVPAYTPLSASSRRSRRAGAADQCEEPPPGPAEPAGPCRYLARNNLIGSLQDLTAPKRRRSAGRTNRHPAGLFRRRNKPLARRISKAVRQWRRALHAQASSRGPVQGRVADPTGRWPRAKPRCGNVDLLRAHQHRHVVAETNGHQTSAWAPPTPTRQFHRPGRRKTRRRKMGCDSVPPSHPSSALIAARTTRRSARRQLGPPLQSLDRVLDGC